MKNAILSAAIFAAFCSTPAISKDFSSLNIGDVACIDRLGPWNKVGTIINKRSSSKEVLIRDNKGKEKWYPAKKSRNVTACKVTKEAAEWLLQKGIETIGSN